MDRSRVAPPARWQSRAEILRAHLDALSPADLLHVRPDYYALRFGPAAARSRYICKYDPNQPRDELGRWVDAGADGERDTSGTDFPVSFAAARGRRQTPAYCMAQYTIDNLLCSTVEPASRRAACRAQAAERLGNCLAGRQIPPLNY